MEIEPNTYPKFLAFLQLSNPEIFRAIVQYSSKADLVEAQLICANDLQAFHALIFSDGLYAQGDHFRVQFEAHSAELFSWDWRWVFGLQIHYKELSIFPLRFQQQVLALPSRDRPLSSSFFKNLSNEFATVIDQWISKSTENDREIANCYRAYIDAVQRD